MGTVYASLQQYFRKQELRYCETPHDESFALQLRLNSCTTWMLGQVRPKLLRLETALPLRIPNDWYKNFADATCRINGELQLGNFSLSHKEGELIYRANVAIADNHLPITAFERSLQATKANMDRFVPVYLSIGFGQLSPAQAVELLDQVA